MSVTLKRCGTGGPRFGQHSLARAGRQRLDERAYPAATDAHRARARLPSQPDRAWTQDRTVAAGGLFVHNLTNASFQVMAEVVQSRLKALGYQMLLCIAGDDPQLESDTLTTLADHRVDGLIVVPTGKNGARLTALANEIPIVCLVRRDDATDLETELADDRRRICGHALSHRSRASPDRHHCRPPRYNIRTGATVGLCPGTARGVDTSGRHVDPCRAFRAGNRRRLLSQLLDLTEPPSAIFVANHEAARCLRVISERGLAIPDDLSLLCYEDSPWFEWHRPAISIVDNGARDLANLAVDRLLQRIESRAMATTACANTALAPGW